MTAHAGRMAAIDIGTVTTRLLVADVSGSSVTEVERRTDITHLGEGLTATGRLSGAAMDRVERVIEGYAAIIEDSGAGQVRAVATSASRDAANAEEFVRRLQRHGITPEVVSGDAEARLAFTGATWGRSGDGILVNDIGGGSTEIVLGSAGSTADAGVAIDHARSLDVGSRRVTELHLRSDPPTSAEIDAAREWVAARIAPAIDELASRPCLSVALAGTATTLSAIDQGLRVYDPARVHGSVLRVERIRELASMLAELPLDRRQTVAGLDPGRAPVIVAGALILGVLLELSGLESTVVSEHDILYGIVLDLAARAGGASGVG